jgi:hypothetical protein
MLRKQRESPKSKHKGRMSTSLGGSDLYKVRSRSHSIGLSANDAMHCNITPEVDEQIFPQIIQSDSACPV